MRAIEFIPVGLYSRPLLSEDEVIAYMKQRSRMLAESQGFGKELAHNWRSFSSAAFRLVENQLINTQQKFLNYFNGLDEYDSLDIRVGSKIAILNAEIAGDRFDLWGFTTPKTITKILYSNNEDSIKQFEFNNDPNDVWPKLDQVTYNGQFITHSIFFGSKQSAEHALTMLTLSRPADIEIKSYVNRSLNEGGWDTALTQGTVLHPRVVAPTLQQIDHFVQDFNRWLAAQNLPPVRRGRPTGSSSYHEIDAAERPDTVYGDIDLQMIAPDIEGKSPAQFAAYWNQLSTEFIRTAGIDYIAPESEPGHPIVQIGPDQYVQIDFMWHPESTSRWGAARVTPERGIKGMLFGNMFSVFGELLDLSIQHAGVQLKVVDGQHVPFSKQKGTKIVTVTTEPETFILDTFKYIAQQDGITNPAIDPLLSKYPGNDVNDVKISKIVQGVKGFARSAEQNNMFGRGELAQYANARDFIEKFLERYTQKAMADVEGKKRDKATTPEAIARAEADRTKILQGLELVKGMFA